MVLEMLMFGGGTVNAPLPTWHSTEFVDISDCPSLDLGWGQGDSHCLRCCVHFRPNVSSANCIGWLFRLAPWRTANASLKVYGPSPWQLALCIETEDKSVCETLRLDAFDGLRRLRRKDAGFELQFSGGKGWLSIAPAKAEEVCGKPGPVIKLQTLHTFVALTFEAYAERLAKRPHGEAASMHPKQGFWQLEWPDTAGRQASLARLAAETRGIQVTTAAKVPACARFAGTHCPVCLESWEGMPSKQTSVVLSCGHAFCQACLADAISEVKAECPSCRSALKPNAG
eukprot:gnl/TRDRNA2_/TRDRNA2_86527_c0_seq1.p1 gnl/TRDRNA2_/TRDRNA2_86527_c0~~gnl/TRDRNA2_/TRDRNA2_86527_c0_seq1.p1  ORF type:complete len:315 (-),score=38.86 gnl/TRDRNA2_/TRDRNA2_86527_c0_seq1:720-1574(-)